VLATATSGAPSVLYVMGQSWHGRGSFQTKARLWVVSGWKRRSNQPALSQVDAFQDTVLTVWLPPTVPARFPRPLDHYGLELSPD